MGGSPSGVGIRGFLLYLGIDADDVMDLLNDYFSALVEAIFDVDGTVDKITGDAILAVFGSPEPDPLRHEKAVRAALAMQSAMTRCSDKRGRGGHVVGGSGSELTAGGAPRVHRLERRMELTIIGEAADRTARYVPAPRGASPDRPGFINICGGTSTPS